MVVDARNDLPEQVPGALPSGLPLVEADCNFVVLDLGQGAFALYAHMQPGSLKVTRGDKVNRGDKIRLVGNTGNSQAWIKPAYRSGPSTSGLSQMVESRPCPKKSPIRHGL